MENSLVIVGAGQAGFSVASKLRALNDQRPITMIGLAPELPYQRPPLSKKYLIGEMSFDRLLLRPAQWYDENAITMRLSSWVEEIDRPKKLLRLQDGSSLSYDTLVLATGSTPRGLPQEIGGNLAGVYTIRNKADADRLAEVMKPGRRLLIIGGGYIGLEAAAVARHLGLEVTVIEMADRILARVAAKETADFIRAVHQGHGVMIRENMGLKRLLGTNDIVTAAELSDGSRLDVDLVIVGIGATANDGLARNAGLHVQNGIIVDGYARTSDPDIFAAGDCALLPWGEGTVRLESVQNAVDQGEAIAMVLAGGTTPYMPKPWFWSDQYDLKLQIAGLNLGYDETIIRPGTREGSLSVWYYRQDRFLAVDAINDAKAYVTAKKLLEAGRSADKAIIGNPQEDLKQLLA
ncbi:pyridine nucleotide-disulfide oxidoreductase [Agrobacterium vitis]|uniref:NAD(P)/FAD-dependent oxidoreductase n=1 Tax=Rhizobium/Agrobacterium group TaxID=227290 RepID=UPI0008DC200C|nr:FAD-dependent oxidoreductase [Agrobacterium vitis]MCF1434429.1 pyridine nucleotide-disulfide oxidoreductase [Allorhizobium ampelinum]MUO89418.1 pyridine nucleotide-disulfide oxidoreductase [Agrobacterium vitis]MUZ51560.1 pyridine nucleotide-disulfide oxidoreductase [Agrobacterium vitis]MUZ90223.1 pyridine nucleotide-disulfide oxidoreductase [Agrobacterium vitis]MVA39162.1 pyridine nucleotide-disulfide oxidoreductase [Agrobacterium vitis]